MSDRGCVQTLFDLTFLEFDVLAQDRIVLLDRELLSHRARVLFRHIVEARAAFAVELDLGRCRFRPGRAPEEFLLEGRVN
jgi:hypothetical protein